MADVPGKFFTAVKVRTGVSPSSPGSQVGEAVPPVNPPGSGLNSVGLTMPSAFTVANSPLTSNGTIGVTGAGTVGQYIRGDGSLADFPESSGGGSSVSYYLNGSVNQGTIGGVAYKELNKVPILGSGTDFTIAANGYIASFLTDAGDPNLLEIPGGNWNFETYFSSSSSGGTPSFYVELYKYNGTTFTLLASNSSFPEFIAFGTIITPYFSTLAVPTTTLALTDRLAIRYYVIHSGRTITLHTEDNHLCQIVTTFTTGITALNGLTAQVQNFAVGTSGTDFAIASATATHTFNLPTASATNRGALSSADWTIFNNKTSNLGTVTSVGLSSATSGVTIGSSPVTTSGTITLAIATASSSQNGLLSSTDWTTFNGKQNALTNPVTGTGSAGQIAYFTGTSAITSESGLVWDATNNNLSIGGATANSNLTVSGSDNTDIFTVLSGANSRLHVGTVTSPSVSTYIRSQNNYALNLGTNTTNYLTILSTGNIGINTATPATAFEVNGVGLFSGTSLVGNTKNGVYIYDTVIASLAGGNSRALQIQAQTLSIFTGTTYSEKLKVFENGNVVISTSPSDNGAKLQVTNGNGISFSSRSGLSNLYTYAAFGRTSDELAIGIAGAADQFFTGSVAGDAVIKSLGTNNKIFLGYGSTAAITINDIGNVSIGDTNPTSSAGWTPKLVLNATSAALVVKGINGQENTFGTSNGLYIDSLGNSTGTNNNIIFRNSSSNSSFSATERMRVTSGGNVLIGTTTDNGVGKLQVSGSITVAGGVRFSSSGADANRWSVYWNGGTGDLIVVNNISDIRAKKDFDYDIKGLETITKLKPLKFTWKDGISKSTSVSGRVRQYGFIAQETMQADDFLAWHNESHDTWGIEQYESFTAVMVKAIQELKQEIDTLKN